MFRSFLLRILLLEILIIAVTALSFYSSKSYADVNELDEATYAKSLEHEEMAIAIFWTPDEVNDAQYKVIKKEIEKQAAESVLTSVTPETELESRGYMRVGDTFDPSNPAAYEVHRVTSEGSQVVTSTTVIVGSINRDTRSETASIQLPAAL